MRILMLNYEFPPLGGGAANATRQILEEFAGSTDLQIDLVTSSVTDARIDPFADNIAVHYVDIGKGKNLHYQTMGELLRYYRRASSYAKKLCKDEKFDLCHAFFGIPCGYMARGLGMPYIVSLRGSDVPFYNPRFKILDAFLFASMSRRIWEEAKFVVANSTGLRELALATSPTQKIGVIPNGVDTDMFMPVENESQELRVICVSRLIKRKGVDTLIRAVAEMHDQPIRLMIVGTGNEEENLKRPVSILGIEGKVEFKGYVPHDELPALYQANDVFVLPSLNEGMSNTVLEAMACGLPTVLTDTGGSAELLRDGGNGFLIRKKSVGDIVEKLGIYLNDRDLVRKHGAESRKIAEQMSWGNVALAYVELYKKANNM
ncbi:glycosyltransferase [Candidatus Hydrogenedentota bacterium]